MNQALYAHMNNKRKMKKKKKKIWSLQSELFGLNLGSSTASAFDESIRGRCDVTSTGLRQIVFCQTDDPESSPS
jgi:hypothetical protein